MKHQSLMRRLLAAVLLLFMTASALAESRIQAFNRLRYQQDWQAALKVIREELADPEHKADAWSAMVRTMMLLAMTGVARQHGWNETFDAEARRMYAEALLFADTDEFTKAHVNQAMSNYYFFTQRSGLAVKTAKEGLEYFKKVKNPFQVMLHYESLAVAYHDRGERQLSNYYRARGLAEVRSYFKVGINPTDNNQWAEYYNILINAMSQAADEPGNRDEMERLWGVIRPIGERHLQPKSHSYNRAAQAFAIGGEAARARDLLDRARQIWANERNAYPGEAQRLMEDDLLAGEGTLLFYAGKWAEAIKALQTVLESRGTTRDPALFHMIGSAHEAIGDFDKAIEFYGKVIPMYEQLRQSFSVVERASFFRSVSRKPYWGLIRSLIKRGRPEDVLEALRTMELVRARQLGEVVDPAATEFSVGHIESRRQSLGPDEAVLAYVLTDTEVALAGMTRERAFARVIPYDARAFGKRAGALARLLAEPDSVASALNKGLGEMSTILIAPIAAEITGKPQLVVLPDGAMNAVPFELLTRPAAPYRPLILDATVRYAPSLRFIDIAARQSQAQTGGLFAVADPVYMKNIQVAGLSVSELRSVTRSNVAANFIPLPETRSEVEAIAQLVGKNRSVMLLGEKASESEVKRADLKPFRYVHLATHGILGGDVPGIGEPALVLAEEKGEDGFLTASEAEKLKLRADLTVLSACNTGSGEHFAGEGVMGMGRAFLVAGSRSVLVSLWPVESMATEALMVSFYRKLSAGQSAAAALRSAKLEMLMPAARVDAPKAAGKPGVKKPAAEANPPPQSERSHPFFWAPFVLFGG